MEGLWASGRGHHLAFGIVRHSGLGAGILELRWLRLALAGHLVKEGVPVLISAHICLRQNLILLLLVDGGAKLAEEILRDRDADKTLIKGPLILGLGVADEAHELLIEGQVQSCHLAISQLIKRRKGTATATRPLLPSPVLLSSFDFLGDPRGLSSLVPHLVDRRLIIS
jgi:hypothetical protein